MSGPALRYFSASYGLLDRTLSDAATTEKATLPSIVQATTLSSALSMVTALNMVHWELTCLMLRPGNIPTTPVILRPS